MITDRPELRAGAITENRFVNYDSKLYPVTGFARELGIEKVIPESGSEFTHTCDWAPLGIKKGSILAEIVTSAPIHRLKFIRQLGPNACFPYPYSHTAWEHSCEQVVHAVTTLSQLAEESPEKFLAATSVYKPAEKVGFKEHIRNVLVLAALTAAAHDGESTALRDSMKFALAACGIEADENKLLARRLADPNDRKYLPILKGLAGQGVISQHFCQRLPVLISRIVEREDGDIVGQLLHARAEADPFTPSRKSKPRDLDSIVYGIQDLIRVLGSLAFDPDAKEEESKLGIHFLQGHVPYMIANLETFRLQLGEFKDLLMEDIYRRVFMPKRICLDFFDIIPDISLSPDSGGKIRLAFANPQKLYEFLLVSTFENFIGMYLTPGMIFTEKTLEQVFTKRKQEFKKSLGLNSDEELLGLFLSITDYEALLLLSRFMPEAANAVRDNSYQDYYYNGDFVCPDDLEENEDENTVIVPIKTRPGFSTMVVDKDGIAKPFYQAVPIDAREIQKFLIGEGLRNTDGGDNFLRISRYPNKYNPFR